MGLGPCAVKLYIDLWKQGIFKDVRSVAEMGSQEMQISLEHFERLVLPAGIPGYKRENFKELGNWPNSPRCSGRPLYELFGAKEYTSVDLNQEYGSIPLDFNKPLEDRSYWGKYDMVTDYGTLEHAFNVSEGYRSMHRLCRQGGYMVILQMLYKTNGYYLFDPSFFEGLAAANNYGIVFSSCVAMLPARGMKGDGGQYHLPLASELVYALDWGKMDAIGICHVLHKRGSEDFRLPYQGNLLAQDQKNYGYQLQFIQEPPSYSFVPRVDPSVFSGKDLLKEVFRRVVHRTIRMTGQA